MVHLRKFPVALLILVLFLSCSAMALALREPRSNPIVYSSVSSQEQTGRATSDLFLNSGPGTRRYFREMGKYYLKGKDVPILAKAWDPNNGIYWLKVRTPQGVIGWTGLKRFNQRSFNLDAVPEEVWYDP